MSRLLVDTHVVLWHVLDDPRLGPGPTAAIEDAEAEVLVSVASFWEIAIKMGLGKLEAPGDLPALIAALGFDVLEVTVAHAWAVGGLPHHHRDPFDRLLIAQASLERLPILTADPAFAAYDVAVTWEG